MISAGDMVFSMNFEEGRRKVGQGVNIIYIYIYIHIE